MVFLLLSCLSSIVIFIISSIVDTVKKHDDITEPYWSRIEITFSLGGFSNDRPEIKRRLHELCSILLLYTIQSMPLRLSMTIPIILQSDHNISY